MATEYQVVCPECDERFMGRTPTQASLNWVKHLKEVHIEDGED